MKAADLESLLPYGRYFWGHFYRSVVLFLHLLLGQRAFKEQIDIVGGFMEKKCACPVCGYYTLRRDPRLTHEVCPVCYWEDDPLHLYDPDYVGPGNQLSLTQARLNYYEFGVNRLADLPFIRRPLPKERPENQRKKTRKKKRIFGLTLGVCVAALALFVGNYLILTLALAALGLQCFRMVREK